MVVQHTLPPSQTNSHHSHHPHHHHSQNVNPQQQSYSSVEQYQLQQSQPHHHHHHHQHLEQSQQQHSHLQHHQHTQQSQQPSLPVAVAGAAAVQQPLLTPQSRSIYSTMLAIATPSAPQPPSTQSLGTSNNQNLNILATPIVVDFGNFTVNCLPPSQSVNTFSSQMVPSTAATTPSTISIQNAAPSLSNHFQQKQQYPQLQIQIHPTNNGPSSTNNDNMMNNGQQK